MYKRFFLQCICLGLALHGAVTVAATEKSLPAGFNGINLLDPWESVENGRSLEDLNTISSDWERYVSDCGYRTALLSTDKYRLLITANNFLVTALSFSAEIKPGSNLLTVANQIIKQYGQPKQATMRDALGIVTIDPGQTQHVLLSYKSTVHAEFSVSGAPLWEYRINIRDRSEQRIENKTLRCARELSKEVKKNAKKSPG